MTRAAARSTLKVPSRLTAISRRQDASENPRSTSTGPCVSWDLAMAAFDSGSSTPAACTTTSTRPWSATARSSAASMPAGSETSTCSGRADRQASRDVRRPLPVHVGDDHEGASLGVEPTDDGGPDPGGPAGDQGHLPGKRAGC